MEQKSITLKRGQVKGIYEYFASQLQQEGKNAAFSYFVYKNAEYLASEYANIVKVAYNENADEKFQEFRQKGTEIVTKYADRDEQGNIKFDEKGQPIITEQIAEFQAEDKKLVEEYKDVLDNRSAKIKETITFLETTSEYRLYVLPLKDFPNNTAPSIVGIFAEE